MMRAHILLLLAAGCCLQGFTVLVNGQATGTLCQSVAGAPGCVCDHPDGRIDIRPLSNSDGTPRYTNKKDPNNYPYSLNPCTPFGGNGECSNVFICQQDVADPTVFYDIADAGTEQIYIDTDDKVYLYYTTSNRYARIYLKCDNGVTGDPVWDIKGDSAGTILHYEFTMTHAGVCPGASGGGGGGADGDIAGPVGLVIIFLLLGAVAAYFIVGILIMKFKFNKTGTELIPQKDFWFSVPFLIKDGFLFTFSPCVGAVKNRGYDKA